MTHLNLIKSSALFVTENNVRDMSHMEEDVALALWFMAVFSIETDQ